MLFIDSKQRFVSCSLIALLVAFAGQAKEASGFKFDGSSNFGRLLLKLDAYALGKGGEIGSSISKQDIDAAYDETTRWTMKDAVEMEIESPKALGLSSLLQAYAEGQKYSIEGANEVARFVQMYSILLPEFENKIDDLEQEFAPVQFPKTKELFYSLLGSMEHGEPTRQMYEEALGEYLGHLRAFHSFELDDEQSAGSQLNLLIAFVASDLAKAMAKVVFRPPPATSSDAELAALKPKMVNEWKRRGYFVDSGELVNLQPFFL